MQATAFALFMCLVDPLAPVSRYSMSSSKDVGAAESGASEKSHIDVFGTRTRFVLMVLVLLCLASIW
uniref:Protein kish n=1 Tax=Steinernema glaseri TaxID=37863 RepID=A0A1I8AIE2_9BILA